MYPNVKAEIARRGLTLLKVSEITQIPLPRLSMKLNGHGKLTFDEAVRIKGAIGVDMPLEELFERKAAL